MGKGLGLMGKGLGLMGKGWQKEHLCGRQLIFSTLRMNFSLGDATVRRGIQAFVQRRKLSVLPNAKRGRKCNNCSESADDSDTD